LPKFFSSAFKNKIILKFVKFVATKKGLTTNFFPPLSFVAVFGSGIQDPRSRMGKNQDTRSRINIPDPQHCSQESTFLLSLINALMPFEFKNQFNLVAI
jgi:hypothetical protein